MGPVTVAFNHTRLRAIEAFAATLDACFGDESVTEEAFHRLWMDRLALDRTIISDGWYQPPPRGAVVLAATAHDPGRISFSTLRDQEYWPAARSIRWRDGLLYVYCSPVSRREGLPGDFAVTLYFGQDPRLRQHFMAAHRAVSQLLQSIQHNETPAALFSRSQVMFARYHLRNTVMSVSDTTPLNLGHTFPSIEPAQLADHLSDDQRELMRNERLFLNEQSEWVLEEGVQFTIEPQLRSTETPDLPQVAFHYLLRTKGATVELQADVDDILGRYGLLSR